MSGAREPAGPLAGLRVVELGGIGPVPYCGMVLADLGADVVRLDRPGGAPPTPGHEFLDRGRRRVALDLKDPAGVRLLLRLVQRSDALIEGFRPGVAERLGVGPQECLARNPALVYGRMTGWGQQGPWAQRAGHDITYLAVTGALHAIGSAGGPPAVPLNLLGDFGGGGLLLAVGVLGALWRVRAGGPGQVVDAAIVDGVGSMMAMAYAMRAGGLWLQGRGGNLLDGGAPFYTTYRCADGEYVAVGAIEDAFYAELLDRLGLAGDPVCAHGRFDPQRWPAQRQRLAEAFAGRTRTEWAEVFEGGDACVAPVLSMDEAPAHPHARARGAFLPAGAGEQGASRQPEPDASAGDVPEADASAGDVPEADVPAGDVPGMQPAPAPRFERTPTAVPEPAAAPGAHTDEVLAELGCDAEEIAALREAGTAG